MYRNNINSYLYILLALSVFAGIVLVLFSPKIFIMIFSGTIIFIISLFFPELPLLLFPFSFVDFFQNYFSFGSITLGDILGILIVFFSVYGLFRKRHSNLNVPKWIYILLFSIPFLMFIRFIAEGSNVSFAVTILGLIIIVSSIISILDNKNKLIYAVISIVAIGIFLSLVQLLVPFFGGIEVLSNSGQKVYGNSNYFRVIGATRDPNYGSMIITISYAYLISLLLFRGVQLNIVTKVILGLSIFILSAGIILSISRTGFIIILFLSVITLLSSIVRKMLRIDGLLLLIFLGLVIFPIWKDTNQFWYFVSRFEPKYILESNTNRIRIYHFGWNNYIRDNILIGTGLSKITFHNTYLDILSFGGIVLLALFIIVFMVALLKNYLSFFHETGIWAVVVLGNALSIMAFLAYGLTIGAEFEKAPWYILALSISSNFISKRARGLSGK